jgi:uracil-DNA glycosylase family 4
MQGARGGKQSASYELEALHREIAKCRKCAEAGYIVESVPHLVVSGPAEARLMVIGQAPPSERSSHGRPFSGPAGQRLFKWLAEAGWDEEEFRARCYITAITKCYPGKAPKGDRRPTPVEQKLCRPFLDLELALVRPEVIALVGGLAIETFLGHNKLQDIVGRAFVRDGVRHIPLPHPSGASLWLNAPENQVRVRKALRVLGRLKQDLRLGHGS